MSTTIATERGSDPADSTAPMARVEAALHLPPRTVAWMAGHPEARQFVCSVWDSWSDPVSTPAPSTRYGGSWVKPFS